MVKTIVEQYEKRKNELPIGTRQNIIIDATNSSSMLRFMEEGNENYIYLIMPVNIRV